MAVSTSDLTVDRLDAIYPKRQLTDPELTELKSFAVNVVNEIFAGQVRSRAEIEGAEVDFAHWIWAHMISLRQKEESSSESQSGGSIAWARPAGTPDVWLEETRFGRTAKGYLRGTQNIGIEKASSSWG